ncbi:MAG TPA: WlaTC/HtrL family glycosyltransferase [Caulobacteraceae bacterium]
MTGGSPTLVTAIFDLGRERLDPPFQRDKDHYRRHLPAVLSIDCPMVVYTDAAHVELVRELRGDLPTRIQMLDPAALAAHALYAPTHQIRADPRWLEQAAWLPGSPQAALPAYNPVVLTKPLWLAEQAQHNTFGSSHFYWIDAGLGHTVPGDLLDGEAFRRLAAQHQRLLLLAYPYAPDREVHGFDADALARLAGVERTRWVARGGLFGGPAAHVREVAGHYSRLLEQTLADGLMGTEESLLTLLSYAHAELFELHFVGADGLIWPFFAELAAGWAGDAAAARGLLQDLCETWFVSYNAPLQFERLLDSIKAAEPALLSTGRRVLINNSTDTASFEHYDALCAAYGLEQLREGNRGINGARIHAADLFHRGGRHAMFWFEDDMLLTPEADEASRCVNGFARYVHGLAGASVAILQREFADFVKLSFTEAFGSHATQWGWHNLGEAAREHYFPGAVDPPRTAFRHIQSVGHVPYAVGEVHYSNWPQLVTRRGTQRLFFEERREPCHEQYWMARSFEVLRQGRLKAAVLLTSPVDHRRTQDYDRVERVEYQRVDEASKPAFADLEPAPAPREWPAEPGTIFVSLANYRDSETPHTLCNLFAMAARPERIRVGVLSQVVPGDDDDCLPVDTPPGQVREIRVRASESLGACWARSRILEELLRGEEYVLQIDSHSRFEPGWDETLIEMLRRCPSPRALLTTYPPGYVPPAERGDAAVTVLAADAFNDMGVLMVKPRLVDPPELRDGPPPSAFLSANCLFGPAAAFRMVRYDPRLYFHGEEISLAARFWTHGWDLYAPDRCFMYHDYTADRGRPRNWEDRSDWVKLNMRSFARLRELFGIQRSSDPAVLRDLDRFGLGQARTLAEYEEFADVTFATSRIGTRAADGRFPQPPRPAALARLRQARERFWDVDADEDTYTPVRETRSGPLSTLEGTAALRPALERWLKAHGVRRLVDAGCGDFNWLSAVDLGGLQLYAGYDIVPELIKRNQELYGGRRGHFFTTGDITRTPLVACDAILCRHVLGDLPAAAAQGALENFRASGATWLLATVGGDIGLPEPDMRLPDVGAALGVWRLGGRKGASR